MGSWNIRCKMHEAGGLRQLMDELRVAKIGVVTIQESGMNEDAQNYYLYGYNIFHSCNSDERVLGTAFLVANGLRNLFMGFLKADERLCVLRLKGRFKKLCLINVHAPYDEAPEADKEAYYEKLVKALDDCSAHGIKTIIRLQRLSAQRESLQTNHWEIQPARNYELQRSENDLLCCLKGLRCEKYFLPTCYSRHLAT